MVKLKLDIVEMEITKIVEDVKSRMGIDAIITVNTCLNNIGITSQIQVSIMSRLEDILKVEIPNNCYIFYDKKEKKQLSIKEAAQKLIKLTQTRNGKSKIGIR